MNIIKCLENYVHYVFKIYKQLFVWKDFSIFEFYHKNTIQWGIGLDKGDEYLCTFC